MIDGKLQAVAIVVSALLLIAVLELIRRRRLVERYSLIWLGSGMVLLILSIFSDLLEEIADLIGIDVPVNALFAFSLGFIVLLLLHFSVAISRLTEENKVLAQEAARLDQELREARGPGSRASTTRQ